MLDLDYFRRINDTPCTAAGLTPITDRRGEQSDSKADQLRSAGDQPTPPIP